MSRLSMPALECVGTWDSDTQRNFLSVNLWTQSISDKTIRSVGLIILIDTAEFIFSWNRVSKWGSYSSLEFFILADDDIIELS